MNPAARGTPERRRCYRAHLSASAMLRTPGGHGACVRRVDDLSLNGAHLFGAAPATVGESVTADIRLDERRRLSARGRIARLTDDGAGFAIVFSDVPARAADLIYECMARALERDEEPAVLLIEPMRDARRELARMLTQIGYRVLSVATPVEAIDQLTAHADGIRAALVSQRLTQTTGVEFVTFLKDAFPGIRRVLTVGDAADRSTGPIRRAGLVHDALSAPWLHANVSRALGVRRRERSS